MFTLWSRTAGLMGLAKFEWKGKEGEQAVSGSNLTLCPMCQGPALTDTLWYLIRLDPDQNSPQTHNASDCSPWDLNARPWAMGICNLQPLGQELSISPPCCKAGQMQGSVPEVGAGSGSPEAKQVRPGLKRLEEMAMLLIALNRLSSPIACGKSGREETCSDSHFEY